MTIDKPRGRAKVVGVAIAATAALGLSLFGNVALRNASHGNTTYSGARPVVGAGIFVDPQVSKALWLKTGDPSLVTLLDDADVQQKLYAGLVKQVYNRKTNKFDVVPDLAASIPAPTGGGLVYTFKLRRGAHAARFADGSLITAQDVVHTIYRVEDPKAQSPVASYSYFIKGAKDYNLGKAKSISGLRAIGSDTVQITLSGRYAYSLLNLTYSTFLVLKASLPVGANLTSSGAEKNIIASGPFMVKPGGWNYKSMITLVPNPYYWSVGENGHGGYTYRKITGVKEIEIPYVSTVDTLYNNYLGHEQGFDYASLPAKEVKNYVGKPEYHETPVLGDLWYQMSTKVAPFNNVHFRRAIAFAIDREAISCGTLSGASKPTVSWYPQGILGHESSWDVYGCRKDPSTGRIRGLHDASYNPHLPVPYYSPSIAKSELAKSGVHNATITLEYPSDNEDTGAVAGTVRDQLAAIGITLNLKGVDGNTWSADGNAGKVPFILSDWYDDYPDPQDFDSYLIHTGAGENYTRYHNPRTDALQDRADLTLDTQKRLSLLRQNQLILLNDAPVAMLYQFQAHAVYRSKYHGIELNPSWGPLMEPVGNDWANTSVSG